MVRSFSAVNAGNVNGPMPVQFNTNPDEELVVILLIFDG